MQIISTCIFPLCSRVQEHDELCFLHKGFSNIPEVKATPKKIPARSEKRKVEQKEYVKIVKSMLAENPNCEVKADGCQVKANGLHHKQKRGRRNFLNRDNLLRACGACQLFIELNSKKALDSGLTVSRFKN